jgi:hypothetical protein
MTFLTRTLLSACMLLLFSQCAKDAPPSTSSNIITSNLSVSQQNELLARLTGHLSDTSVLEAGDRAFLNSIKVMANSIDDLYAGVNPSSSLEEQYQQIRANMYARVSAVADAAMHHYNGSKGNTILAKNSYVLMGYDALQRYAPEFWWTQLGIFAANEVRAGVVLAYLLNHVLTDMQIDLVIHEMTGLDVPATMFEATEILLGGQEEVFSDIGALALMNKLHGPEIMSSQTWLTEEAQRGYAIQIEAEKALANRQFQQYKDLQTTAAIEFGAHEQIYILQKLWDKSLMAEFSKINEWLMGISKGQLSVFGAIFIGTNKYGEMLLGYTIPLPKHATDLTKGIDRVEIARNGFETLNRIRKQPYWENWIKRSQARLGGQYGVYHVRGLNL